MTRQGWYERLADGSRGVWLSLQDLLKKPAGTEVIHHAHLGDEFVERVSAARRGGGTLEVIRKTRTGRLAGSEIVEQHTGHEEEASVRPGIDYTVSLHESASDRLPRGREQGKRYKRRANNVSWLHKDAVVKPQAAQKRPRRHG